MLSWRDYIKNVESGTSVSNQLVASRARQVEQNRHYIRTLAEIILLCAKQDLPLRGHRESQISLNRKFS